jgi:hypothetical protein
MPRQGRRAPRDEAEVARGFHHATPADPRGRHHRESLMLRARCGGEPEDGMFGLRFFSGNNISRALLGKCPDSCQEEVVSPRRACARPPLPPSCPSAARTMLEESTGSRAGRPPRFADHPRPRVRRVRRRWVLRRRGPRGLGSRRRGAAGGNARPLLLRRHLPRLVRRLRHHLQAWAVAGRRPRRASRKPILCPKPQISARE